MYAVIQTGGKQYRVAVGDRLKVETLQAQPGDSVELDKVLMISDQDNIQVGTPLLEGQTVSAQVIDNDRAEKIKVFKMQRRQGYRRTQGHRQNYTEIEITAIAGKGNTQQAKKDDPQSASNAETSAKPDLEETNIVETNAADTTAHETSPVETVSEDSAEADSNPQASVDDLTQINGIGPVISEKLNSLGYTSFAQIASLDEAGVAQIEEQLSFKGRIEREDWIKQAAELSK